MLISDIQLSDSFIHTYMKVILGSGRSPRGGNGNPLQYSYLDNLMDRGTWWAAVHGVRHDWSNLARRHATTTKNGVKDKRQCICLLFDFHWIHTYSSFLILWSCHPFPAIVDIGPWLSSFGSSVLDVVLEFQKSNTQIDLRKIQKKSLL